VNNGRSGGLLAVVVAGVIVLAASHPAQATAIATSDITAFNLTLAPDSGAIAFDVFIADAFAQAQNSLGELDQQFDSQFGAPAAATALVTWATADALTGEVDWSANTDVSLPGTGPNAASSVGQAIWSNTFTVTGGTGSVDVEFSADLNGLLSLMTDAGGQLAETQTIFTLLLDGEIALFDNRLRSIGASDSVNEPFAVTLSASRALVFDTPYSLILRVDSESRGINAVPVPEPATLTLFCLGAGLAGARAARRRATSQPRRSL
jgi:hypothetical protein